MLLIIAIGSYHLLSNRNISSDGTRIDEIISDNSTAREKQSEAIKHVDSITDGLERSTKTIGRISDGIEESSKSVETIKGRIDTSQDQLRTSQSLLEEQRTILDEIKARGKNAD